MWSYAVIAAAMPLLASCRDPPAHNRAPAPVVSNTSRSVAEPPPSRIDSRIVQAKAFEFNYSEPECYLILREDHTLCPSAVHAGKVLSRAQMENALAAHAEPEFSPATAPWCWNPHYGIVFYDAADHPVSAISVCFDCERQAAWPQTVAHVGQLRTPHMSPTASAAYHNLLLHGAQGLRRRGE